MLTLNLMPFPGAENSSDTESAPSPSPVEAAKPSEDAPAESGSSRITTEAAVEQESASNAPPAASPPLPAQSVKPAENETAELQVKEEATTEGEESMEVENRSQPIDTKPVLNLVVHTKVEPVEAEARLPEDIQVKMESDAKERDGGKPKEKLEPEDMDFAPAQQASAQRMEPNSDNDSSATCSADEEVDGEPERQR